MQRKTTARAAVVDDCRVKNPEPSGQLDGSHIAAAGNITLTGPLPVILTVSAAQKNQTRFFVFRRQRLKYTSTYDS
jgi:hypothetical protein